MSKTAQLDLYVSTKRNVRRLGFENVNLNFLINLMLTAFLLLGLEYFNLV